MDEVNDHGIEGGNDDIFELDLQESAVLEQQLQSYILSTLHQETPREEKIQNYHRMAVLLEQEEANYQRSGSLVDDERDDHPIGVLLTRYSQNEELHVEIFNIIMHSTDTELLIAVFRLVLAAQAGTYTPNIATEEEEEQLVEKLCNWIVDENTHPVLRAFALGLLQKQIDGNELAAGVASSDVPPVLVKRLTLAVQAMAAMKSKEKGKDDDSKQLAVQVPSVDKESDSLKPALSTLHITNELFRYRELVYLLGCLAAIGEYVDILAPVLQLGGMDAIFYLLKLRDELHLLYGTLALLTKLMAHLKFTSVFVDKGGIELLVTIPRGTSPNLLPFASLTSVAFLTLATFPTVVEQLCLLSEQALSQAVEYTLWLLKSPDETAKKNAGIFWTMCMPYRTMLDFFDAQDGPKVILSELKAQLNPQQNGEENEDTDFPVFSKTVVFHLTFALRNYFRMHLVLAAQPLLKNKPSTPTPRYKSLSIDDDIIDEAVAETWGTETNLSVVQKLISMEGTALLAEVLDRALDSLHGISMETARCVMDIFRIVTVTRTGMHYLLATKLQVSPPASMIEGEEPPEPIHKSCLAVVLEVMKFPSVDLPHLQAMIAALKLLANFVYFGDNKEAAHKDQKQNTPLSKASPKPRQQPKTRIQKSLDDVYKQAIKIIRSENGISTIISILKSNWLPGGSAQGPNTESIHDVRAMACKVLLGLARDPTIKQVLNKKLSRWLPDLLRDPAAVLTATTNKRSWERLKSVTLELIGVLTGRDASQLALQESIISDPTLSKIERDAIVSATPIRYSSNELLELITQHLYSKGLYKSARMLIEEASLPPDIIPAHIPLLPASQPPTTQASNLSSPPPSSRLKRQSVGSASKNKLAFSQEIPTVSSVGTKNDEITLDSIVKQFLMDQHRHCVKPISVLPEMSLKTRHQCPIPAVHEHPYMPTAAPLNVTRRLFDRSVGVTYSYNNSKAHWRRFTYSRFRPLRNTYGDEEISLTSILFWHTSNLLAATSDGALLQFDVNTTDITNSWEISEANQTKTYLKMHKNKRLLLTFNVEDNVKLWDLTKMSLPLNTFNQCAVATFNNAGDRIIGTTEQGKLMIYDTETFKQVGVLADPAFINTSEDSEIRVASVSADDALVLCDAVLWDVRARNAIHRFDKFTDDGPESFSPHGLEVIINSEIWDVRSFKLLKTCPALDSTFFRFNNAGDVILAGIRKYEIGSVTNFSNKFRVVDCTTYDLITELTLDRCILDIAIDPTDSFVALLESPSPSIHFDGESSFARLWQIGKVRGTDSDDDEEEEEEEEDDDSIAAIPIGEEDEEEDEEEDGEMDDSDFDDGDDDAMDADAFSDDAEVIEFE